MFDGKRLSVTNGATGDVGVLLVRFGIKNVENSFSGQVPAKPGLSKDSFFLKLSFIR